MHDSLFFWENWEEFTTLQKCQGQGINIERDKIQKPQYVDWYRNGTKLLMVCRRGVTEGLGLKKKAGWYSVSDRDRHLYLFIYKVLMWNLPPYKCASLQRSSGSYQTRSNKTSCHCKSLKFLLNLENLLFEFLCLNCLEVVAELPKKINTVTFCDFSIHNHKPVSLCLRPFQLDRDRKRLNSSPTWTITFHLLVCFLQISCIFVIL